MMNDVRFWRLIIVLLLVSITTGCGKVDSKMTNTESENGIAIKSVSDSSVSDTEDAARERHIYNQEDPDRNLLLQFLNDEIPLINYEGSETVYYSQLGGSLEDGFYYIVDMDGDGKNEFCFSVPALHLFIKYNEEKECFELWLQTRIQEVPIGNGKTYAIEGFTDTRYTYYEYDENGNLLVENFYSYEDLRDENTNEYYTQYRIENEAVTQEKWEEETAYLFDLIETVPYPLTYDDLLGNNVIDAENEEEVLNVYWEFLNRDRKIEYLDIDTFTIPTDETGGKLPKKYAFWDSNGDGVLELHLNSGQYYYVFSIQNGEPHVWKRFMREKCFPLKDGAFIKWSINIFKSDLYTYCRYDASGQKIDTFSFSWDDLNDNGIHDSEDEYLFKEECVTQDQWNDLTSDYICQDEEGVWGIANELDWIVLYEETF